MAHSKPTSTQQALYQFVVQNASIGPKAQLVSHHIPNAVNHEHLVATAQLQGDAPAHFTMSLPQLSNKVFIGITDAHPDPLAKLIAGFSADSLRDRIIDCGSKWVFTSDEGKRGGR